MWCNAQGRVAADFPPASRCYGGAVAVIRSAGPGDIPDIATLAGRIWRACYPGIIPEGQIEHMLARQYDHAVLATELGQGVTWLVAEERTSPVGFASGRAAPDDPAAAWIDKCYVDPDRHARGIGGALLDALCDTLVARGARSLRLRVNRANRPAIDFYRSRGFLVERDDRLPIGGGWVMDDHIMRRDAGVPRGAPERPRPAPRSARV